MLANASTLGVHCRHLVLVSILDIECDRTARWIFVHAACCCGGCNQHSLQLCKKSDSLTVVRSVEKASVCTAVADGIRICMWLVVVTDGFSTLCRFASSLILSLLCAVSEWQARAAVYGALQCILLLRRMELGCLTASKAIDVMRRCAQ